MLNTQRNLKQQKTCTRNSKYILKLPRNVKQQDACTRKVQESKFVFQSLNNLDVYMSVAKNTVVSHEKAICQTFCTNQPMHRMFDIVLTCQRVPAVAQWQSNQTKLVSLKSCNSSFSLLQCTVAQWLNPADHTRVCCFHYYYDNRFTEMCRKFVKPSESNLNQLESISKSLHSLMMKFSPFIVYCKFTREHHLRVPKLSALSLPTFCSTSPTSKHSLCNYTL